jgi:hypothetical protein
MYRYMYAHAPTQTAHAHADKHKAHPYVQVNKICICICLCAQNPKIELYIPKLSKRSYISKGRNKFADHKKLSLWTELKKGVLGCHYRFQAGKREGEGGNDMETYLLAFSFRTRGFIHE